MTTTSVTAAAAGGLPLVARRAFGGATAFPRGTRGIYSSPGAVHKAGRTSGHAPRASVRNHCTEDEPLPLPQPLPEEAPSSPPRRILLAALALLAPDPCLMALSGEDGPGIMIRTGLAPDQSLYDPSDSRLRSAASLLQQALNAEDVAKEEELWTRLIDEYATDHANWADDVVGRALGNRGNARARQGRLEEAILDYNTAIERCPWSVDPVLNRGVALETMGRYEEARRDYLAVLEAEPSDAAAWNNLGNVEAASLNWEGAFRCYDKAAQLAPQFSFAAANRALARFEMGEEDLAIRDMRALLRRYPEFPDVRAALTAALWRVGKEGEAESNWGRVSDVRYKDLTWLIYERRWPPSLVRSLSAFLNIDSVAQPRP